MTMFSTISLVGGDETGERTCSLSESNSENAIFIAGRLPMVGMNKEPLTRVTTFFA